MNEMKKIRELRAAAIASLLLFAASQPSPVRGDEGMWLFNDPPKEQLRARYGVELSEAWLNHLMKASVRFNSGGSGAFVSEHGLIISNHHVGADALQKLSSQGKDYLRDGFHATSLAEEAPCVDLELNVLQSIQDVTERVNAALPAEASPEEAFLARRAVIAEIEQESKDSTGLRSDVVTLYQGGKYHLHRFKRYTDVRLVFAPEQQIAFYGGDPDNFEYPRHVLDVCFFRAYEDGRPARVAHWLKWSKAGATEGELTFVAGHPGRTDRQRTVRELESMRDQRMPYVMALLGRREVTLSAWAERDRENERRAKDLLFGIQNARKAYRGMQAALLDPSFLERKQRAEAEFKRRLEEKDEFGDALKAYDRIAKATPADGEEARRYALLEGGHAFAGEMFGIARTLLRVAAEGTKPNGERLPEYQEAGRPSLELRLFSEKPIYPDLERIRLADSLTFLAEQLGSGDDTVRRILAGMSPRERAYQLVSESRVADTAFRREAYEAPDPSAAWRQDPFVRLADSVDAESRRLREAADARAEIKKQAQSDIASARFALEGSGVYPDATFTLRLAVGTVQGLEVDGRADPPWTTYAGLYRRAEEMENRPPYDLPARWEARRDALDLSTPLNFIANHDIVGGNSGSPVVNLAGEYVGIIFDGNIYSLVLDFMYDGQKARCISVHSAGIIEALRRVYQATSLVAELEGQGGPS